MTTPPTTIGHTCVREWNGPRCGGTDPRVDVAKGKGVPASGMQWGSTMQEAHTKHLGDSRARGAQGRAEWCARANERTGRDGGQSR